MNTLENLIFSNTFRDAVRHAVEEAVAEANALNLPKAYDPEFSQARIAITLASERNTGGCDQIAPGNPANRR